MSHPLLHPLHRRALESDLDRLVEIHRGAFPDARGDDARRRNFATNPLGSLGELHVVEHDGVVVAHAFLFALEAWFGGRRVPVGAIASVGVAPEQRGRGIATSLLEHLHRASHERGDALTMLYPFRQGYYARDGYVAVTPTRRLELRPESIPRAWNDDEHGRVRSATSHDRAAVIDAYERAATRTSGWFRRPAALWEKLMLDERHRWSILERGGAIVGYVHWQLEQDEPHARTELVVHEIVADDRSARRRLLGMLGALRDQVANVVLETDADDPLDRALVDADGNRHGTGAVEHALGVIAGGPMIRIEDPARAIAARGYDERFVAELGIEIVGEGALAIHVAGGQAHATKTEGRAHLRMEKSTLAALLFGGLRLADAWALGWVDVEGEEAAEEADAVFAHPPFFALDRF